MIDPVKTATGETNKKSSPFLVLTARELEGAEDTNILRDYIKLDRIEFIVDPPELSTVPILEECRALCDLENFDVMFDLTMQYLANHRLTINLINDDRSRSMLGSLWIQDKHQDLRGMQCISEYPYLALWLTEFMAGSLSKKFPLPLKSLVPEEAKKETNTRKKSVEKPPKD